MPLPIALLLSDWSEKSNKPARPDINNLRDDLHKVLMKNPNIEYVVHNRYNRKNRLGSFKAIQKPKTNESKSEKFDKLKHVLEPGQNAENTKLVSKAYNILMRYTLLHDTPQHTKFRNGNHHRIYQKSQDTKLYSNSNLSLSANCESKYKKSLNSPLKVNNLKTIRSKFVQNKNKKSRTSNFRSNCENIHRDPSSWRQSNEQKQYLKSDSKPQFYNTQHQQSSEPSLLKHFPNRKNISPLRKNGNDAVTPLPPAEYSLLECPSPILEAVSKTNININSIMKGYSMDTICPFMFLGSKKFDEEIAMHKVLYASRRAFLDQIPKYEDTRREVRASMIEAAPESHAALRSIQDKASSSKLSVHAPPFRWNPGLPTNEKTTREVGNAFFKFVSSLDEPTLKSLAPLPSCSTSPVPVEEEEQVVGYDKSREQDNNKDDGYQSQPEPNIPNVPNIQNKPNMPNENIPIEIIPNALNIPNVPHIPDDEPNDVPALDGEELSNEEQQLQAENAAHGAHGAVGAAKVEEAAAAWVIPPPAQDRRATLPIQPRTKIIYQNRNILNLGENLWGQWREIERWQVGPDARAFSSVEYPYLYEYNPNYEQPHPPVFACEYCATDTEPSSLKQLEESQK